MKRIKLKSNAQNHSIILNTDFIDELMPNANGEYVKVYLLLLRQLSDPQANLSVSRIADILDITENDVVRALRYWKKQGLVDFESEDAKVVTTAEPELQPNITPYRSRAKKKELKEALFVAEKFLGKTLTVTEAETIGFIVEDLKFPFEIIDYMIEYCVENGHKDMRYIKKVAIDWEAAGIKTIEDAKGRVASHNKICYSTLRAFGIAGRAPAESEVAYIRKWNKDLGFSTEMILEACDRTISAIHKPSFEYTDTILQNWYKNGVKTFKDISELDHGFQKEKENRKQAKVNKPKKTKFNNFAERSYDMDDLEKKLIQ
ncbi:MAG: DnaD domain protein [Suipraeoptans sp.]